MAARLAHRAPRRAVILTLFLVLSFALLPSAGAKAQEQSEGQVILVVDVQRVIREAQAVRLLQQAIERRRQVVQQGLLSQQEALREEEQALIARRDSIGPDAFAEERREFQQKIVELQREVQTRRSELDRLYASGFKEVENRLGGIVAEIASERAADLVFARSAVIYVGDEMDITQDVLLRLNQSLPEVPLPDAAVQAPSGGTVGSEETEGQ